MRHFKWKDWNRQKLNHHALSPHEVESAFNTILEIRPRRDGSYVMKGRTAAGRVITVIWRYDDSNVVPDALGDLPEPEIFVITAY